MNKRSLIILLASLCCIGLGALIYYQINHDLATLSPDAGYRNRAVDAPPAPAGGPIDPIGGSQISVGRVEGVHFIKPGEREFGFASRVAQGDGSFTISQPWVKIFARNGKTISIRADLGTVPVEVEGREPKLPSRGALDGNVTIELYPTGQTDGIVPELAVTLDHIDFEREFSRLVSRGPIRIETRAFQAAGVGLFLQYDQINERLQELEISQIVGDMLIHYGDDLFAGMEASAPGGSQPDPLAEPEEPAPAGFEFTQPPVAPVVPPAVYSLMLSDRVTISQNDKRLSADRIELLAGLDLKTGAGSARRAAGDEAQPVPPPSDPAVTPPAPPAPIRIACSGPLRITTLEDPDRVRELWDKIFVTAFGAPATFWSGPQLWLSADTVSFSQTNRRMVLLAGPERPVRITPSETLAITAGHSIQINSDEDVILVNGPGRIILTEPNQAVLADAYYAQTLKLNISDMAVAFDKGYRLADHLESIEFPGELRVKTPQYSITARSGRFGFAAPPAGSPLREPLLTEVRLTQAVLISPAGEFKGDQLTAQLRSDPNLPHCLVMHRLVAAGQVTMQSPDYFFAADRALTVLFEPDRTDPNAPWNRPADNAAADSGALTFADRLVPVYILAEGSDNQVHFIHRQRDISLRGNRLEGRIRAGDGDLEHGLWEIEGRDAAIVYQTRQTLNGRRLSLDLNRQFCRIDGAGQIEFTGPMNLLGPMAGQGDTPLLLHLAWANGAEYNLLANEAVFYDATIQTEQSGQSTWRHTTLHSPRLALTYDLAGQIGGSVVSLADVAAGDTADAAMHRSLAIDAGGPVYLESRDFLAGGHSPLSTSRLMSGRLSFDSRSQALCLSGPGWIDYIDQPLAAADGARPREKNMNNLMSQALPGDENSYTLIRFADTMRYDLKGQTIGFANGISIFRVPLAPGTATPPDLRQVRRGSMNLFCRDLEIGAGGAPVAGETANPAPGVQSLRARGNVFLEICRDDLKPDYFSSETLSYDRPSGILFIQGSPTRPAQYIGRDFQQTVYSEVRHTQFQSIRYNLVTNEFEAEELQATF